MDGIAATRTILAEHPEIKIIAMTSFEEEQLVQGVRQRSNQLPA